MEDLCIGNLTIDTSEDEILALLGLNSTAYLYKISLTRREFTDNGRFAGCIHVRMPQRFIETVLELIALSLKNRELVLQPPMKIRKLQQSGKRNNYRLYGGRSFHTKQGGRRRGTENFRVGGQASTYWRNRKEQPRPDQ